LSVPGSTCEIVTSGPDWLTVTGKRGMKDMSLLVTAGAILDAETENAKQMKDWRWNRYNGRAIDGISYGVRDDGAIFRLSGEMALRHWRSAVKHCDNCSRFDVQVTVRIEPPDDDVAGEAYVDACAKANEYKAPSHVRAIVHNGRFESVYLGSRQSSTFGRLYDKYNESEAPEFQNCWRYEVEFKEPLAVELGRKLATHPAAHRAMVGLVHQWFVKRGVEPRFTPGDEGLRVTHLTDPDDDDRAIRWFRNQVGPVVARVSANGRRGEALRALGVAAEVVFTEGAQGGA
jgi:hypothetical protein